MPLIGDPDMSVTEEKASGSTPPTIAAVTPKLPNFWPERSKLWFTQVEANFAISRVTEEQTKYNYVVAALPPEIAVLVEDVLEKPPTVPYTILDRTTPSVTQQIASVLNDEPISDQNVTAALRDMRHRLGPAANDQLLKVRLLQRLPEKIAFTLSAFMDKPVDELAKIAESMFSYEPYPSSSVNATRLLQQKKTERTTPEPPEFCYYHSRFGARAKKCRPPCKWAENEKASR